VTYRLIPQPPAEFTSDDPNITAIMRLWWYNNPVDPLKMRTKVKIPLPKEPGPIQVLPLENMLFPLTEWEIPFLHDSTFRRIAIFPTLALSLDFIKLCQYATLGLIYQFPTAQITAGLIISPSVTATSLAEILRIGLSISLVPITFLPA